MTNPNPSPGRLLSSTSTDLAAPRPSFAAVPASPPPRAAARSSIPSKSRGSRVSVTGTESRKLVLWMRVEAGDPLGVWAGGAPRKQEPGPGKCEARCARVGRPTWPYLGGVPPVGSLGQSQPGREGRRSPPRHPRMEKASWLKSGRDLRERQRGHAKTEPTCRGLALQPRGGWTLWGRDTLHR